jgi:hypothetical protein
MSKVRVGLMIVFMLLPVVAAAQTKKPTNEASARPSGDTMIVEPGSE